MKARTLHQHMKKSVCEIISRRGSRGFRCLLESGSTENFLRDLLAIKLTAVHRLHRPIREFRCKGLRVDLAVGDTYIEVKQLHLKDGLRYIGNVSADLQRHRTQACFGAVYVLDARLSRSDLPFYPFHGADRRAKHDVQDIIAGLQSKFGSVYPANVEQALLRHFAGNGPVFLYGFVVSLC